MAEPFNRVGSTDKGVTRAVRGRASVTLEQIENLLAEASSIQEVKADAVRKICQERKTDLARRLTRGRTALYGRYLRHCFADNVLTEQENTDLAHLRAILQLSPSDVSAVQDEVAVEVYGEAVDEVLADFSLDDDEAAFLRRLREDLGLPEERAERIFYWGAEAARARALSEATSGDEYLVKHRAPAGQFVGRSTSVLEEAIDDALSKAAVAIPQLHWFEVTDLSGYVEQGRTSSWHVTVRAGIKQDE
jgi:flavin-binding protein dodecin